MTGYYLEVKRNYFVLLAFRFITHYSPCHSTVYNQTCRERYYTALLILLYFLLVFSSPASPGTLFSFPSLAYPSIICWSFWTDSHATRSASGLLRLESASQPDYACRTERGQHYAAVVVAEFRRKEWAQTCYKYRYASLNDGDTFWEMRR